MQAQRAPALRGQSARRLAVNQHHSRCRPHIFTRQRVQQLPLAVARHAGNAHLLAGTHLQVNAIEVHAKLVQPRQAQSLHLQ